MRVANCKIVCREIEEADVAQPLAAGVMQHLRGCAHCQAFHDSRVKLRALAASLGGIEAPADFDFRVRWRIASEKAVSRRAFLHGRLSFGFPSVALPSIALATLLLLLGAGFALRSLRAPTSDTTSLEAPVKSNPGPVETRSANQEAIVATDPGTLGAAKDKTNEASIPVRDTATQRRLAKSTVAVERGTGRQATREFSSTPAHVVKQDEALASLENFPIFPVEASSQPLKLSLDYDGVSRTISVPTLSFGSQRLLSAGGPPVVKTSSKRVW